jgi:tetratricopeptide (TPR) repeat protein/predicted Ser/Thr protein kinase
MSDSDTMGLASLSHDWPGKSCHCMDRVRICEQCRQPLLENATEGLCPQCQTKVASDREPAAPEARIAPEVAELAIFFPQLEIIELLGMGGMGMVYKARQPQLDRLVAVKILPMDSAQHPSFAERFGREAKALAKLNHPGIVDIYDFGRTGQYYYFVMEYVDGMDLRELLNNQTVAPRQTLELVVQICTALQYAHDEGVVHRDIKPANILVNKKGQVKIADFGLAKLLGVAPDTALTTSQAAMGTLNYMAPEQRENAQRVDHRADIYSLGVVFYEMLTGEVPMGRFEPPSKKVQVDARLDDVVLRALERDPAQRYQQASEVKCGVEAIAQFPATAAGMARWVSWRRLRLNWPGWLPASLLIAAALLALAFWLRPYAPALHDIIIPPDPEQRVARASNQLERYDLPGHIESAIKDLKKAVLQDASYTDAQALLGLAYWRLYKRSTRAEDRFDAGRFSSNALACNKYSVNGLFVAGLVAQDDKRANDATNNLSLANERAGWENGEVLIQLAMAYWYLEDTTNSLRYVRKANDVLVKPWYFFNTMGFYEHLLGNDQAAQTSYRAAIAEASDSPIAWLNLGQVHLSQTNRDEHAQALYCIQKSQSLAPTEAAYDALGEFFMDTSNWLAAATNFQEAAKINPDRYDFPGNEGLVLIHLPEKRALARLQLTKALDKARSLLKDTLDPEAAANCGLYQAALGQATEAYTTFQQVMESSANTPGLRDNVEAAAVYLEDVYKRPGEAAHIRQLLEEKVDKTQPGFSPTNGTSAGP